MFSLVIPTLNSAHALGGLLRAAAVQSVKPDEIIVIDSSSGDTTASIAEDSGARVISIPRESFDHGETRTRAVKEATGEFVVLMTPDALPADRLSFENLIKPLEDNPEVSASYGRQIPHRDATVFAGHLRAFNYPEPPSIKSYEDRKAYGLKTAFLSNSFSAYRRSALEENGWFMPGLILGEDTCMAARMLMNGSKIAYEPDACVYHSHNYTVVEDFMRYFDTGVFHTSEPWLIEKFGKAEGEGMRYLKSELSYLNRGGNLHLLPEFFIRNLMKYSGYKAGRMFRLMPSSLAKALSMHKGWWDKGGKVKG